MFICNLTFGFYYTSSFIWIKLRKLFRTRLQQNLVSFSLGLICLIVKESAVKEKKTAVLTVSINHAALFSLFFYHFSFYLEPFSHPLAFHRRSLTACNSLQFGTNSTQPSFKGNWTPI